MAQRKRKSSRRAPNDSFSITHRLIEERTYVAWSGRREKPHRYWDERWDFRTTSKSVAYEEAHDAIVAVGQHRVTRRYFEHRNVSIMIRVWDPEARATKTFTASASAHFETAIEQAAKTTEAWAQDYGRQTTDEFSHVKGIEFFMRYRRPGREGADERHAARWRSVVAGRAARREDKEDAKRRKALGLPPRKRKTKRIRRKPGNRR